jgi:flavin-dependent dehydrogenase
MCRSPDFERYVEKESLKVKAFFVRFTGLPTRGFLPDSLTLLYPPRINEAAFELDGSKIRPDSPAFVTLHRVVKGGDVIYGSRERVRVWEGIRFEVYMSEERVIKGIFRKDEGDKWKLECECEMEEEGAAEVVVAAEGHVAKATMARKHRRRRKQKIGFECLEEIPEEREEGRDSDGGVCFCTCSGESDDGEGEWEEVEWTAEMESETEGMGWAVDLGIWVMCLGVGYLVSKASTKTLTSGRRRRTRRTFF